MYRCTCTCSTRALEAFVADFAGISIKARPQRLQRYARRLHSAAQTNRPVDAVSLQAPTSGLPQRGLRMIELAPVLEPAPTGNNADDGVQSPARTKAESRMLRKLKRIQDGSHNKSSQDEKLVNQVQEMLQKIEESPQILGGLVGGNNEKERRFEKEKPRRRRSAEGKGKWVKESKEGVKGKFEKKTKEGSKGKWAKARKESIKEQIANDRAGEETVEIGDEVSWEHIQDQWTEAPEWVPDDSTKSTKTTKNEKSAGKQPKSDDMPSKDSPPPKSQEPWGIQKSALEQKFGEKGWQPRKRLSPDTLSGIRALHASNPTIYNVDMLREHFKITPEAIRRILKSKWRPSSEEIEDRMQRWEKRGVRKWSEMAEQGQKPPKKWRALGVPNPKLGKRKVWDSNSGVAPKEEKTEEMILKEEGLFGKSRRMENAQRMQFKESLAGRIL